MSPLSRDVKAWGWTIRELRENGVRVRTRGGKDLDVPRDVRIHALLIPPPEDGGRQAAALDEATSVFEELDIVTHLGEHTIDDIGEEARTLLA